MDVSSSPATLKRLCGLLGAPYDPGLAYLLSPAHFEQWKPLAEKIARAKDASAEHLARLLIEVAQATGGEKNLAIALWTAANMYYRLSQIKLANDCFEQAASLYQRLGDTQSSARMSVGWVCVLSELGQYHQALTCAKMAETVLGASTAPADQRRLAGLNGNVGIVYELVGQLVEALDHYQRKWQFYDALIEQDLDSVIEAAQALNNAGVVQTHLGQYLEAAKSFSHALEILTPTAESRLVWADTTLILLNKAWLETIRQSPFEQVTRAFEVARHSRDRLDEETALRNFAFIDLFEANWLIHKGQWRQVNRAAIEHLSDVAITAGMASEHAYAKLLLGQLSLHAGEAKLAELKFEEIAQDATSQNPAMAYVARMWQARALCNMGDFSGARMRLELALIAIEQTRRHLTSDDYRAGYLEGKLVAYHDLIQLDLDTGNAASAFVTSERTKARTLAEALAVQMDQSVPNLPPPTSLSIEQVAAQLSPTTLIVSYTILHGVVWAFLITGDGLVEQPVQLGACLSHTELESGLRKLQRIIYTSPAAPLSFRQQIVIVQKTLQKWYADYLAPLQPWLDRYERIVISPDGLLNALPFGCLYNERGQSYFAATHEITIAPSLAIWSMITPKQRAATNVLFQPQVHQALVIGNSAKDGVPDALPQTIREAQAVAAQFTKSVLLIEQAVTFDHFIQAAPQADFIYMAAHGEYQIGAPAASFIELADRPLCVADILTLKLKATTVVLSACETSKGYLTGNEMMGLVRAFLYAGAKAVVATHWSVEDSVTFGLMTKFIQEVCAGKSLANALKTAQCELIGATNSPFSHPFYWGAFTIIGNDGASIASVPTRS